MERASLGTVIWLLEQMNAKNNPITAFQVYEFGEHPGGPILPDGCLEVKKLPDEYQDILALSVSPAGLPCLIAKIDNKPALVIGKKITVLNECSDDFNSSGHAEANILGFANDDKPITEIALYKNETAHSYLFWGSRLIKSGALKGISLIDKDTLVYQHLGSEHGLKHCFNPIICLNLSVKKTIVSKILKHWTNCYYVKFFETAKKSLCGISLDKKVLYIGDEKPLSKLRNIIDYAEIKEMEQAKQLVWHRNVDGSKDDGFYIVPLDKIIEDKSLDDSEVVRRHGCVGKNDYYSNMTAFYRVAGWYPAYIGATTRHRLKCWVIDGRELTGFRLVSPLFKENSQPRYYGIIGKHLYTIAIPEYVFGKHDDD